MRERNKVTWFTDEEDEIIKKQIEKKGLSDRAKGEATMILVLQGGKNE